MTSLPRVTEARDDEGLAGVAVVRRHPRHPPPTDGHEEHETLDSSRGLALSLCFVTSVAEAHTVWVGG